MEHQMPVGEMLRRARHSLGYSQYVIADELARVSGNDSLTREEVARWERGKRLPGPYWRRWICLVLRLPVSDLEMAIRSQRSDRRTARGPLPHASGMSTAVK
ncbi:MAG: helix-turn-helix transcriptional regulator [Kribbellaceae bacterium]|nr:helix-turn-helix transcriptional regulator [Kribbellaceae bacterium]